MPYANEEIGNAHKKADHIKNRERDNKRSSDWYYRNKDTVKKWRLENYQKVLANHRKSSRKRNGFPEPTRAEPRLCECCSRPPGKKSLSLDHDHITGAFRGWLCTRCNTAIGKLGDNIDGVQMAIDYLKRAKQ